MNRITFATSLTALALVLSTAGAQALEVGLQGTTDVTVQGTAASSSTDVSADANTSVSAGTGTQGGGSSTGSSSTASGAAVISVTRADISSSSDEGVMVSSYANVRSNEEVKAYVTHVMKTDADTAGAEASDKAVSLSYKARVKLFGLIPVFVNATATAKADGTTEVSYPWYAFLATKDSTSLEADVHEATAATLASHANADAGFDATTKAQLIEEIHSAMKANLEANLTAEAALEASTQ